LREKARVASIFVRTDGEAASDEKTSEEEVGPEYGRKGP
jgi:hypothetical protein